MGRRKKEEKPVKYQYFVRIGDNEPVDMDTLPKEEHDRICRQLSDNFMTALGYEKLTPEEAAKLPPEQIITSHDVFESWKLELELKELAEQLEKVKKREERKKKKLEAAEKQRAEMVQNSAE